MSKLLIALFTSVLIVGIGGMVVPAQAHDCGCQVDNSGPGSSGPDNSGPGNACHDNSGPGSTTSGSDNSGSSGSDNSGSSGSDGDNSGSDSGPGPNSGPGSGDECPPDDPGDDDGGDSGDNPSDSNDPSDSGNSASDSGVQVLGAEASVASSTGTQSAVPSAVNAGLTDTEESSSTVAALMILLGLGLICGATVRRRTRA